MNEERLRELLREAPLPAAAAAERRSLAVVAGAFAQRQPRKRPALPRLATALAAATLLAALLLSPAGAAVRHWVGDTFTASTPRPEPALAKIPGGGRLLVQSSFGPWVVQPDGSRRLLGDYEEATWSPHGLFVAAVKGRTLSALEPDGTPRWSITAGARIGVPRWSLSGERIAYRAGFDLHVIAGDGTEDRLLAGSTAARTRPDARISPAYVAPDWSPTGANALAYVNGAGRLRIVGSESGSLLAAAPAMHRITWMDWGAGGRRILEASPEALRVRPVWSAGHPSRLALRKAQPLPLSAGATVVDAALAPNRPLVAASITYWKRSGTRSTVVVFGPGKGSRVLLTVPGSLGQVEWSPDGRRLLAAWPGANQWLFLPLGRGKGRAVANILRAFSPGGRPASFPRLAGWCCAATVARRGARGAAPQG